MRVREDGFWFWVQMAVLGTAFLWWDSGGMIAGCVILGFHFFNALFNWIKPERKSYHLPKKTDI